MVRLDLVNLRVVFQKSLVWVLFRHFFPLIVTTPQQVPGVLMEISVIILHLYQFQFGQYMFLFPHKLAIHFYSVMLNWNQFR